MPAKKQQKFDIGAVIAAAAAGFVADKVDDLLTNKIDFFRDNPGVTPAVVSAGALGAIYFGSDSEILKAAGYGALGVAGSKVGDTLIPMDGFNRLIYKNSNPMKVSQGFNRVWYNVDNPQSVNGNRLPAKWGEASPSQEYFQNNVARELGLESVAHDYDNM